MSFAYNRLSKNHNKYKLSNSVVTGIAQQCIHYNCELSN